MSVDREKLFQDNLTWASVIARNVHRKVPPCFDLEDLKQVAQLELWKRAQLYDPDNERRAPFQGYAYIYVRSACLMSVRRRNWVEANHETLSLLSHDKDNRGNLISARMEAEEEEQSSRRRLVRFFEAVPPPVPSSVVLLRTVLVEGVEVAELARERGVTPSELTRTLHHGVRQLRRLRQAGTLSRISVLPSHPMEELPNDLQPKALQMAVGR